MECAFGILSNNWRTSQRPLNVSPDLQSLLLRPVLFRIILFRERDGYNFEGALTVTGLEYVPGGQSVCGGLTH